MQCYYGPESARACALKRIMTESHASYCATARVYTVAHAEEYLGRHGLAALLDCGPRLAHDLEIDRC